MSSHFLKLVVEKMFSCANVIRLRNLPVLFGSCLSGTTPSWSGLIRSGKILSKQLDRNLAYNLVSVCTREIALKLAGGNRILS